MVGRRAGGLQGHLSPERQISGCQRAGSFWKASSEKRKKTRPPLSNKLIKSYPNRRAENLTHSSGLWGEIFRREGGGGCWRKKVGNDRGRGGFDVGKTESGGLGHNKRQ